VVRSKYNIDRRWDQDIDNEAGRSFEGTIREESKSKARATQFKSGMDV